MTFEEFLKFTAELSKYFSGGVVGVILGHLLKTQIDHRLAIARIYTTARVTEFNKAVASCRAAFAPSLALIYLAKQHGTTHEVPDVDAFLNKSLPDLAAAVEIFRPFVPKTIVLHTNKHGRSTVMKSGIMVLTRQPSVKM